MNRLKTCFIGYGSIAKRHIKNLCQICDEETIEIMIDLYRSGKGSELEAEYSPLIHKVYYDLDEVPSDYDIIFVTNPTKYHLDALKSFWEKGKSFFVEKPLTTLTQLSEAVHMSGNDQKVIYIACPLRYKKIIQYVKENIDPVKVYSVRAISSSYLPDWRPSQDYREVYSSKKELGGGVSIDLVHEWDYLRYLFGMPEKVFHIIGNVSDLEISSEDIALYIAQYEHMTVELHLDYFGRTTLRELQIFMKEETIVCNLITNDIRFLREGREIHFEETRDDYQQQELRYFMQILKRRQENTNTVKDAIETLKLAGGEYKC